MNEGTGEEEPTFRLDHFLQACGVETGGQAKVLIQSNWMGNPGLFRLSSNWLEVLILAGIYSRKGAKAQS